MKRTIAFILAIILAVIAAACSNEHPRNTEEADPAQSGSASVSLDTEERGAEEPSGENTEWMITVETGERSTEMMTEATEAAEEPTAVTEPVRETEPPAPTVLTVAMTTVSVSDPYYAQTSEEKSVIAQLFTGLYFWDTDYRGEAELVPGIAEGWPELSEDALTATITLKETRWSDGEPLTAEDFARSFLWAADRAAAGDRAELFSCFDTEGEVPFAEAGDELTLILHLKTPCFYLPMLLARTEFVPVTNREPELAARSFTVTNGAYTLVSASDEETVLSKNPYYYCSSGVFFDEIHFRSSHTAEEQYALYKTGAADVIGRVPETAEKRYSATGGLLTQRLYRLFCLEFDTGHTLFAGKTEEEAGAIRKAVNLLIDRSILKSAIWGEKTRLADMVLSPGMSDGNSGEVSSDRAFFNAQATGAEKCAEAIALLESAGYSFREIGNGFYQIEPELLLTAEAPGSEEERAVLAEIAEDLSLLGISVGVNRDPEGEGPLMRLRTVEAAFDDPAAVLMSFREPAGEEEGAEAGDSGVTAFEAFLREAEAAVDADRRSQALKDAEDALMEEWRVLPLCYKNDTHLLRPGLSGIYETPLGITMYCFAVPSE